MRKSGLAIVVLTTALLAILWRWKIVEKAPTAPDRRLAPAKAIEGDRTASLASTKQELLPSIEPAVQEEASIRKFHLHLLELFKAGMKRVGGRAESRFALEAKLHLIETRLLARSAPRLLSQLSASIAEDPTKSGKDRRFGLHALSILLEEGYIPAEEPLLRLSDDLDPGIAEQSVHALSMSDIEGRHRDLFLRKAGSVTHAAVEAIGGWGGPSERKFLRDLQDSWRATGQGPVFLAAQEIDHIDLLSSNDWKDRLAKVVAETSGLGARHIHWAIAAARLRDVDSLKHWLRDRLDRGVRQAEADAREMHGIAQARVNQGAPEVESTFVSEPDIPGTGDLYFDDVLVAYYRIGGKLTQRETARLTTFGYLGDPLPRVNAFLESK